MSTNGVLLHPSIGLVFYAGGGFATAITTETGTISATTEIVDAIMTATMTTLSTHLLVFQGWVRCKISVPLSPQ
jgi:hypothetical protein